MLDAIEVGYAIKGRRAELGLTQAQVAEAAGVSKRCLWSLELGRNPGVQLDKLTAVLGALGLDLSIAKVDAAAPATPSASQAAAEQHARQSDLSAQQSGPHTQWADSRTPQADLHDMSDTSPHAIIAAHTADSEIDAFAILTGASNGR